MIDYIRSRRKKSDKLFVKTELYLLTYMYAQVKLHLHFWYAYIFKVVFLINFKGNGVWKNVKVRLALIARKVVLVDCNFK